jgi:calcium-binding protein CML
MPPSSPLVKLPSLPGLLSYLPTTNAVAASPPQQPAQSSRNKMSSSSEPEPKHAAAGNKAEAAELTRVFELFDKDGDGRITREEMEESLRKLGMPVPADELASMIARIDANGDGCVDVEEFEELYRDVMAGDKKQAEGGKGQDEDMRVAFRVFDANGDGYITVDELGAVLASLGLKQGRTAEECRPRRPRRRRPGRLQRVQPDDARRRARHARLISSARFDPYRTARKLYILRTGLRGESS